MIHFDTKFDRGIERQKIQHFPSGESYVSMSHIKERKRKGEGKNNH
jgi:hypothetical protein